VEATFTGGGDEVDQEYPKLAGCLMMQVHPFDLPRREEAQGSGDRRNARRRIATSPKTSRFSPPKKDQFQVMSFGLANSIKIPYSDAVTRLLKLLIHAAVHNAFLRSVTESLTTTLNVLPGKTLNGEEEEL